MEGATTLLGNTTHFPMTSKHISPQSYARTFVPTTRKRKPVVTYQSPGSGVVDMSLLIRNAKLEFEAASAAAIASRNSVASIPAPAPASTPSPTPSPKADSETNASWPSSPKLDTNAIPLFTRPMSIPRQPRPLYHPLLRPLPSRSPIKSNASSTSVNSHTATLSTEPGRRSSSRTRRPALKVRDTESAVESMKVVPEKSTPTRRKRGGAAAKRKQTAAHQEADGDSTYLAVKRPRKSKDKTEAEVDGHPSTNDGSPPTGYSTRTKKSRTSTHNRAESATSDGTGSAMPINGPVEEFWVPTKTA